MSVKTLSCSLLQFVAFLYPLAINAQTTVLSQSFKGLYNGSGSYCKMNELSGFEGWVFSDNCYALKKEGRDYMQVGAGNYSSYSMGNFTTSSLGFYGNATLLIKTVKSDDYDASFKVTLVGDGSVVENVVNVNNISIAHTSAILIKGCVPTTKIKIEGTRGKFLIVSMKVFSIGDAIFYESFDYMASDKGEFYSSPTTAKSSDFDNSSITIIEGTAIMQSTKGIFFNNVEGKYTISNLPVEGTNNMLLSFKIGQSSGIGNHRLIVSCDDDTALTDFNSANLSTLSSIHELQTGVPEPYSQWHDYVVLASSFTNESMISFQGTNVCMNDVMIYPIPVCLDQKIDNTIYIRANAGQSRDVTLLRTLTANIWCPLCLPFDVTQAQMEAATGTSCELRTLTSVSEGVFNFDVTTNIAAGTPFLVKTAAQVVNPVFTGVTVVSTPAATAAASTADYQFVGTYSPVTLATDGSNLFLGIDGQLYRPKAQEGHDRMNGLRAYFVVPATKSSSRVAISVGGETAGVKGSHRDKAAPERLYDLQGRPVKGRMTNGLYVQEGQKVLRP